jgi:hypothetical protein
VKCCEKQDKRRFSGAGGEGGRSGGSGSCFVLEEPGSGSAFISLQVLKTDSDPHCDFCLDSDLHKWMRIQNMGMWGVCRDEW